MTRITQMYLFPMDKYLGVDIYPKETQKWLEFMKFHEQNPRVYETFSELTHEAKEKGFKTIGAHLIIQRMRWESHIEGKERAYKICNNHFPYYARLFILNNPDFKGFFELRKLKE